MSIYNPFATFISITDPATEHHLQSTQYHLENSPYAREGRQLLHVALGSTNGMLLLQFMRYCGGGGWYIGKPGLNSRLTLVLPLNCHVNAPSDLPDAGSDLGQLKLVQGRCTTHIILIGIYTISYICQLPATAIYSPSILSPQYLLSR